MDWSPEVPKWCNSTTKRYLLKMDQACLTFHHVNKEAKQQLELWGQAAKCQEVQLIFNSISLFSTFSIYTSSFFK